MEDSARSFAGPVLSLALIVMLGACAAKAMTWQKPNISVDEQQATLAQCRSFASTEAERDFVREQDNAVGGQSTYQKNMAVYQVGKNKNDLLSRCMKLNGYRRVPASN